jgi:hypothetical protein
MAVVDLSNQHRVLNEKPALRQLQGDFSGELPIVPQQ